VSKSKDRNLGSAIRAQRAAFGLTQRRLAAELGVKGSYISYLEKNRRRPSIALLNRIGEILGLERSELLAMAYPETREFVAHGQRQGSGRLRDAWSEFSRNSALLRRYRVTSGELNVLRRVNLLGSVANSRDFLFVLSAIRQALANEPA